MLSIKDISFSYRNNHEETSILDNLNLDIGRGEIVAIIGPNGCGKTTLFNILNGVQKGYSGKLSYNNQDISEIDIGFVFQDYKNSLYPWLSAFDNIALPLKARGVSSKDIMKEVKEFYHQYESKFSLETYPYNLSGGQQQLIAIIRALIIKPNIFLLDEPFTNLDYQTTLFMMKKLLNIWQQNKITTLLVSHNIEDAIFISHEIVLLTDKPTQVKKVFKNPVPFPRTMDSIGSAIFNNFKKDILKEYQEVIGINN